MGHRRVAWRRDPEILARLPEVERRHLEGKTNVEIAAELGVVEGTVRNDLKHIRELWLEHLGPTINELKGRSVAFYRQIEAEALRAFHDAPDKSLNRSAYLNTAKSSEDSIVAVLGLKAPEKHEESGTLRYAIEYVNDWRSLPSAPAALPSPGPEDRQESGGAA